MDLTDDSLLPLAAMFLIVPVPAAATKGWTDKANQPQDGKKECFQGHFDQQQEGCPQAEDRK